MIEPGKILAANDDQAGRSRKTAWSLMAPRSSTPKTFDF
jgi:hypothetical protein